MSLWYRIGYAFPRVAPQVMSFVFMNMVILKAFFITFRIERSLKRSIQVATQVLNVWRDIQK